VARRAAFGIAFASVLLVVVELGLRIAGVRPAYRVEDLGQWRVTANLDGREMVGPRDQHGFVLSTNADGLRTRVPVARTGGRIRVALLGDSTVFGWGVNEGESVSDGVQAALGDGYEVMNAGQPGYSTTMMSWLFGEVVESYQPDITVVFVPLHDTNLVLVSDREVLNGGATTFAKVRVGLARESSLYQAIRGLLFDMTDKAWLLPFESSTEPRVQRVSDLERTQALDDMRALMAGWGGRLAVGFLPFKGDIEDGDKMERSGVQWAQGYASVHDVGLVDVRACCAGNTGFVLADDPGHLTRAGNFAAGAQIAAKLLQSSPGASP
jgi:hypothetical protein